MFRSDLALARSIAAMSTSPFGEGVVLGGLVGFVGLMAPHLARWRTT